MMQRLVLIAGAIRGKSPDPGQLRDLEMGSAELVDMAGTRSCDATVYNLVMSESAVPRRAFLGVTAATALSYSRVMGANERIQLGLIGCGERGRGDLGNFVRTDTVTVSALCDIYETNIEAGKKVANNSSLKTFADHRKLLEMPGLDAVLIAVPDHWHSRIAIDALNAGKDVYVEKPLTLKIEEGPEVVKAARIN